ncbi:hypothetical protein J7I98_14495 [Streptomyces sp. ISL-98]|nr:hypothetical protein [Streptomyces sp. ISL-98]
MPAPTPVWFHSLTESVYALGAAAREYRIADQAARIARWNTDPTRLLPVDGVLSAPGPDFFRPHDDALWQLGELYRDLESRTKRLYENTALAYAHGTAAVLESVLKGECPRYVGLSHSHGRYTVPGEPLPDLREALGEWAGSQRLAGLRDEVLKRERAHAAVNGLDWLDDLVGDEVAEVDSSPQFAAGLADSAYAYGESAESALHFLLLATRTTRTPEEH